MIPDVAVLGDQRRLAELGLADEKAIEGVPRPIQRESDLRHIREGEVTDFQPDLPTEAFEDHLRRLSGPPDLEEILKLQLDGRRDQQVAILEKLADLWRKKLQPPREHPA